MGRTTYSVAGAGAAGIALLCAVSAGTVGACGSKDGDSLLGDNPYGGGAADVDGSTLGGMDGGTKSTMDPSYPDSSGGEDGGGPATVPFEPVPATSYVAKVKNLMIGLPPTDAEVAAVVADPTQLRTLIDTWMATPQFQGKMIEFFRNAFQQNQVTIGALGSNVGMNFSMNGNYTARLQQSMEDSFALTTWNLVQAGTPLNKALTTSTYMLTTAQMVMMAYMDERLVDDSGKTTDRLVQRTATPKITLDPHSTATLAQTLNPSDTTNFMVWPLAVTIPGTCTATDGGTASPPLVYTNTAAGYGALFNMLFGIAAYTPCYPTGNQTIAPTLSDADFGDWHPVTINVAGTGQSTSPVFWDLPSMRSATAMTLHTPRVGFSGTLAYAANWGTNITNEARVTANQSLIVSIGQSIDGDNIIVNFPVNATDADHASNPACQGCHSQLDPMKQYFRQSYSLYYHDQTDAGVLGTMAGFAIDGVTATGHGVGDLMGTLSTHPRLPLAWAQKLQFWANSTAAEESDPELIRIAAAFQSSNYDFKTLAREVFSSPLVTFATATQTTKDNGVLLSISRRDHYCAALSNRLGITDICGQTTPKPTSQQTAVAQSASLMAVDAYYRAFALPSLPTDPDLFFRATVEAMCTTMAAEVVDVNEPADSGLTSRYSSKNPTAAVTDMVTTVMGLPPSDARTAQATTILNGHFTNAEAAGAAAGDALKSTFVLACTSPSAVLLGL